MAFTPTTSLPTPSIGGGGGASSPFDGGPKPDQGGDGGGFMDMLEDASKKINEAEHAGSAFAAGADINPHDLARLKAEASLELQAVTTTIAEAVKGVRTLMQMPI